MSAFYTIADMNDFLARRTPAGQCDFGLLTTKFGGKRVMASNHFEFEHAVYGKKRVLTIMTKDRYREFLKEKDTKGRKRCSGNGLRWSVIW